MVSGLKQNILLNLKNIPGRRTDRKILVIECDDWGGIRMPSEDVYRRMVNRGMNVNTSRFNRFDTLESYSDLRLLFNVLSSVKDSKNQPAVFTAITTPANPDFHKIRESGFSGYYYEPFTTTLKRYYPDEDVFGIWTKGISNGIFIPELHGRDHTAVNRWMDMLRSENNDLQFAFDNGFVALDIPGIPDIVKEFRSEYFFSSAEQKNYLIQSIKESIFLFKQIFGVLPRVFVPPNGIFHPEFDSVVAGSGVKYLYVSHRSVYPGADGNLRYRYFTPGQKGPKGLIYYIRNCSFEPAEEDYPGIDQTISQIKAAFRWGKPAIISTHRVNFVGGLSVKNRDKGLAELEKLLSVIVRKWPDIEFMSSGDALDYMYGRK